MSSVLVFVFLISIGAGFIDAIAGGGGLVLLPTLMFAGLPAQAAVATNKLFNVSSSSASALRFWRSGSIRWDLFTRMIGPALLGSLIGSRLIGTLSRHAAEPVVAALLIGVAVLVLLNRNSPEFGRRNSSETPEPVSRAQAVKISCAGFSIGIHDGFFGPGAGVFLIFALTRLGKSTFLGATSTAKIINVLTSLIALIAFIRAGQVNWLYGIVGSVGVMIGSHVGASCVGIHGARLIRPMFLFVAVAIAMKLVF